MNDPHQDSAQVSNIHRSDFYDAPTEYRPARGPLDFRSGTLNESTIGAYFWSKLVWVDHKHALGLMDDLRERLSGAKPHEEDNGRSFPEHEKALSAWLDAHGLRHLDGPRPAFDTAAWVYIFNGCPLPIAAPPPMDEHPPDIHIGPGTLDFTSAVKFEHEAWDAFRDSWDDFHGQALKAFKAYLSDYRSDIFRRAEAKGHKRKPVAGNIDDDTT